MKYEEKFLIQFFIIFLTLFYTKLEHIEEETLLEEYLICRQCGSDITLTNFLIEKLSPVALSVVNQTIYENKRVLIQEVQNPLGIKFKIILLKQAHCAKFDTWSTIFSWFPGYAWKLCICPKCTGHLGWMFEPIETATKDQNFPSEKGFYALIYNNILLESYVNSLLMKESIFREN
uniref:Putative 17 kDa salivary protein n=1 Tax=Corethrella appendiculata TaxID=1370023 RepID=U5EPA1_9DIPT